MLSCKRQSRSGGSTTRDFLKGSRYVSLLVIHILRDVYHPRNPVLEGIFGDEPEFTYLVKYFMKITKSVRSFVSRSCMAPQNLKKLCKATLPLKNQLKISIFYFIIFISYFTLFTMFDSCGKSIWEKKNIITTHSTIFSDPRTANDS